MKKRTACAIVAIAAGSTTHTASAQEILYARTATFAFSNVGPALRELDLDFTGVVTFEDFLDALRSQEWDLVIVRGKNPFSAALQDDILTELEAHVARGGALHFQMSRLDEVTTPRYYELLGLEGAVDLELPLLPLDPIAPRHPSMPFSGLPARDDVTPDYGDELEASPGSRAIIRYEDAGDCTVVSHSGRVIVNGLEWDNWAVGPGAGQTIVREQLRWLLRCPADLDLDGTTTINDFLVFQNLFAVDDPSVDFDGDGELTIFDFLEYLNEFNAGCP